ncbi:unnamed protein product [Prorocentrum cordatum]|uniref:Uncharacterized protein n=1 Tax=Prorocentrum cordatum TaxID=2364126 RepID=A0ABN9QPF6_9DINO|nr:unnamed protein product [Polarella glacialis]
MPKARGLQRARKGGGGGGGGGGEEEEEGEDGLPRGPATSLRRPASGASHCLALFIAGENQASTLRRVAGHCEAKERTSKSSTSQHPQRPSS